MQLDSDLAAAAAIDNPLHVNNDKSSSSTPGCGNMHLDNNAILPTKNTTNLSPIIDVQISHPTSSDLAHLPRSVRWQLHLRILSRPSSTNNNNDTTATTNHHLNIHSIQEHNASILSNQRNRYTELEHKHYWKSTPTCIAEDTTPIITSGTNKPNSFFNDDNSHIEGGNHVQKRTKERAVTEAAATTTTTVLDSHHRPVQSLHHVAPGDDPLSALLHVVEPHPTTTTATTATTRSGMEKTKSTTTNQCKTKNSDIVGIIDKRQGGVGSMRWAEFYSTREVLYVIEKDLDRLPSDHHIVCHEWRTRRRMGKKNNEKEEEEEDGDVRSKSRMQPPQQQHHEGMIHEATKYEESRCMQHQKLHSPAKEVPATMAVMMREDDDEQEVQTTIQERAVRMSQILFVYAREHPEIGYRQGMHEVLDYIMLAFETDILMEGLLREKPAHGGEEHYLIDPNFIIHDAFTLFECIMASLASAYDATLAPGAGELAPSSATLENAIAKQSVLSSPLESLTASIMSILRFVERDEILFNFLLHSVPVPPNLYFAKWIRLMFVREVSGGMNNVMSFLDAFFELAWSVSSSSESKTTNTMERPIHIALLDVWMAAACGMIILIRHKLLSPNLADDNNGTMVGHADPSLGVGCLMNYPPLENTEPLVETIIDLLIKEKKLPNTYHSLPKARRRKPMKQEFQRNDARLHPSSGGGNAPSPDLLSDDKNKIHLPNSTTTFCAEGRRQTPIHEMIRQRMALNQAPVVHTPTPFNHDMISGTIENIAGGILDFTKTASAAITSLHRQFEQGPPHSGKSAAQPAPIEHPLQRSSNGTMILTPPSTTSCASSSSSHKSLKELSSTLEQSAAILIKHFNDRVLSVVAEEEEEEEEEEEKEGGSKTLQGEGRRTFNSNGRSLSSTTSSIIPDDIWDAIAKIDLVRLELLTQHHTSHSSSQ